MSNLDSINKILENEVKITQVGDKSKRGLFISLALASSLAIGGVALYVTSHTDTNQPKVDTNSATTIINHTSVLDSMKASITNLSQKTPSLNSTGNFKITGSLVDNDVKTRLEKAMDFEIPKGLADNQVGFFMAKEQFKKNNYDLSVLAFAEGFTSIPQNDLGYASTGCGTSEGRQTKALAKELISSVSSDKNLVDNFVATSATPWNNAVPFAKKTVIAPKQALAMAGQHLDIFKKQFIEVFAHQMEKNPQAKALHNKTGESYAQLASETFSKFAPNEQAAFAYHTYKVGEGGAAKYGIMLNNAITYGLTDVNSKELKEKVTSTFDYTYKLNGQTVVDKAAATKLQGLWEGGDTYGALLGVNMPPPDMVKRIPALSKYNIEVPTNGSEIVIPDPYNDAKLKAAAEGKNITQTLVTPASNIENIRNAAIKNGGLIPKGWY